MQLTRCLKSTRKYGILFQKQQHHAIKAVCCRRSYAQGVVLPEHKDVEIRNDFVPMTKRTLIRKLAEQKHLVSNVENFQEFSHRLDAALFNDTHKALTELKQLYDPLNPDKETMTVYPMGNKERIDQEFWLLQRLGVQLERAHFVELPREHLVYNLRKHPVQEGVLVDVDVKKYDVLRAWVLGVDVRSPDHGFMDRLKSWYYGWPKETKHYKRVVLAVRTKKQKKLILKAFKDLPANGLEYFLPEGKIKMSLYDKRLLATTITIGASSVAVKLGSFLMDYNVDWIYIVGGVTGLMGLKGWNAYKNKRNRYLVNISKALYYKTIANNRALLSLITDRAGDEVFKTTLLAYTFVKMHNRMKGLELSGEDNCEMLNATPEVLKEDVETWLMRRFNFDAHFDPKEGLRQLEKLGILTVTKKGGKTLLQALDTEQSLHVLPICARDSSSHHEEELEVEIIPPETDPEKIDQHEKQQQFKAENSSNGWF